MGAEMMKAVVKTQPGPGNVSLEDMPEPELVPGGVKIRVAWTGICGTDLHVFHDTFRNYPPVILGHEFSGIVEEIDEGVRTVRPGDRVTVLPSSAVVESEDPFWREGYYMFCRGRRGMGHGVHGSMARAVVVREDQVYPLPESVTLEEAALAEPLASAYQPICELAVFRPGEQVLLSGPGPIGLLCLILLVRQGCQVLVAGAGDDGPRLELARRFGAAEVVDVSREDLSERIASFSGVAGMDHAVECAGAPASVAACLKAVKPMGQHVQVGILGRPMELDFDLILYKQLRVIGSLGHSLKTWRAVMRLLEQRTLDLKPVITHQLRLDEWEKAFKLCQDKEGAKVLLQYGEGRP